MRIRGIIQLVNITIIIIGLYILTNTDIPVQQIYFEFGFIQEKADRQGVGWGEGWKWQSFYVVWCKIGEMLLCFNGIK